MLKPSIAPFEQEDPESLRSGIARWHVHLRKSEGYFSFARLVLSHDCPLAVTQSPATVFFFLLDGLLPRRLFEFCDHDLWACGESGQ